MKNLKIDYRKIKCNLMLIILYSAKSGMAIASKTFCDIYCDAIMTWINGFDFLRQLKNFFVMRLFYAIFDLDNFLRLENLAQTSYKIK